jgi:hypothetical protein
MSDRNFAEKNQVVIDGAQAVILTKSHSFLFSRYGEKRHLR